MAQNSRKNPGESSGGEGNRDEGLWFSTKALREIRLLILTALFLIAATYLIAHGFDPSPLTTIPLKR
ncbi:hypothetical protein GCM10027187_40310 [Streptosporangium sandarakinum]|uniref:Uncharacterized protein n=1 Tax=Streptosporangium sandarakinum TaxID=1260955 RepID=A0A852VAR7_9ACTN|nr:hypothetical protein [Streptosporangium sandarakinum]NYF44638.1 hypothetical protein [Streptosporangium sandarakinum]